MKRSLFLWSALVLSSVFLLGATFAEAQSQQGWSATGWVSSASISDLTGNSPLSQGQLLIAGHSYNLTLQVNVPNTSTSSPTFSLSLNNALSPAATGPSGIYWTVHTSQYPGYNRTAFVGGSKTVTFNYIQGTLKLSAYFEVPGNFTIPVARYSTPSGNRSLTLHLTQQNVMLVAVVPQGSTGTGSFSASVEDQTIQTYLTTYNQTANLIPTGKISSTYSSLVDSILSQAQTLYKIGLPANGTALLNVVVPSAFPTPPSTALQTDLLAGLGVAVVVIIILAVLMLRSRGRTGYSTGIIGDVQKDLAVLEVTAAKYDRAMADKLKTIRNKLSETS